VSSSNKKFECGVPWVCFFFILGSFFILENHFDWNYIASFLEVVKKYRIAILGIGVSFVALLHTIYSFVNGMLPRYNGLGRTLVARHPRFLRNSYLLYMSWTSLVFAFIASLFNYILAFACIFLLICIISFYLCRRYFYLVSERRMHDSICAFENEMKMNKHFNCKKNKIFKNLYKHIENNKLLYVDALRNEERNYTFSAILFRNHFSILPMVLPTYIGIGMVYHTFAIENEYLSANKKELNKYKINMKKFVDICALIFKNNVKYNLRGNTNDKNEISKYLMGSLRTWVYDLGKYFDVSFYSTSVCLDDVVNDICNLLMYESSSDVLFPPKTKVMAKIHNQISRHMS